MDVLQIGELTTHFTDDFKATYSDVPWSEMRRMRNIFAHRYGTLDIDVLWGTIMKDTHVLKDYCGKIILQLRNQEETNQLIN
ncbi:MAG: DUF86 domain-containing protein [Deltaproteobacteria bacterium]|jgi:uncharacterized protein with HEPN domain|nr:DUF86 domain-containing protein [Deltaproteobacteria bacterium]